MKKITITILLFSLTFMSLSYYGCATILGGSTDDVSLYSEPTGAKVFVNGENRGKTPISLSLKKNKEYEIEFKKDGFETKTWHLSYSLGAGWLILDILLAFVGLIVDAITGAWNGLDADKYKAILEPIK